MGPWISNHKQWMIIIMYIPFVNLMSNWFHYILVNFTLAWLIVRTVLAMFWNSVQFHIIIYLFWKSIYYGYICDVFYGSIIFYTFVPIIHFLIYNSSSLWSSWFPIYLMLIIFIIYCLTFKLNLSYYLMHPICFVSVSPLIGWQIILQALVLLLYNTKHI